MVLVDSSVWIDYFRGHVTRATDHLDRLLGQDLVVTGDLILAEVLQGFRHQHAFDLAKRALLAVDVWPLAGQRICLQAANNYRALRAAGVTPRKTIDGLIATWCIENDHALLHDDRDFDPFARHLGLKIAA